MLHKRALVKIANAAIVNGTKGAAMIVSSIPVRTPDELRQRLEAEAKANDRRLSAEIRVLLVEALTKRAAERTAA
ncbi:hypothetical protein [Bradyrhizobium jicamae]|uniref:hypothetical protein n=1 Tax=Bradyrhizobium jicamae TaxID=280332 RepID=UPI001BAA3880|nr:hypothetical protein [Bradyrhizobium jicamae]MBR0936694.1 hypothetical protein [Bradyrhizobium jicamae]